MDFEPHELKAELFNRWTRALLHQSALLRELNRKFGKVTKSDCELFAPAVERDILPCEEV